MDAFSNALRLSQSRARLAEESLWSIEGACRGTFASILKRQNECVQELRRAEHQYALLYDTFQQSPVSNCGTHISWLPDSGPLSVEATSTSIPVFTNPLSSVPCQDSRSAPTLSLSMHPCAASTSPSWSRSTGTTLEDGRICVSPESMHNEPVTSLRNCLDSENESAFLERMGDSAVGCSLTEQASRQERGETFLKQRLLRQLQYKIHNLRQQNFGLLTSLRAMEAHLAPCLFPLDKSFRPTSPFDSGGSHVGICGPSNIKGTRGPPWLPPVWAMREAEAISEGMQDHGGALGRFGEPQQPLEEGAPPAEHQQQQQLLLRLRVAERAALDAMQRARQEAGMRAAGEQSMAAAMDYCRRQLQDSARKIEDSNAQCRQLTKENARLARRLRHQAKLLEIKVSSDESNEVLSLTSSVSTPAISASASPSPTPWVHSSLHQLKHILLSRVNAPFRWLSSVDVFLRKGIRTAWHVFSRLFLPASGSSSSSARHQKCVKHRRTSFSDPAFCSQWSDEKVPVQGKLLGKPNGAILPSQRNLKPRQDLLEGPQSCLAPAPCMAWETGSSCRVANCEVCTDLDSAWDGWEEEVEVISHRPPPEEPWHTVFFIHVVFAWQDVMA
eukprot:TRINITY_DN8695_c0_g1_i1.p1 TRINITY_DN8695_c0_g1~~TRINITY_DN8695_c0_g1_i1.p1  ORF type:complete len:614 (-),score=75.22 TRINITY_DN8695_c0_g1_i1:454-2295(-)